MPLQHAYTAAEMNEWQQDRGDGNKAQDSARTQRRERPRKQNAKRGQSLPEGPGQQVYGEGAQSELRAENLWFDEQSGRPVHEFATDQGCAETKPFIGIRD